MNKIQAFFLLTKPKVLSLVLLSGLTSIFLEQSFFKNPKDLFLIILGLFFVGASANSLNQIFEIKIDSLMERTKKRRPLVIGIINIKEAYLFSITTGLLAFFHYYFFYNSYSAFLSLFTIFFYSFFYTLYLKPYTVQNIVIGGIAGAMAPLIAWAALRNSLLDFEPWFLFFIIFLWTPPHFWALSLYFKKDYEHVQIPMLPVVKGEKQTIKQITYYTLSLFIFSLSLFFIDFYWIYSLSAFTYGFYLTKKAFALRVDLKKDHYRFFIHTIFYLYLLLMALILDSLIKYFFT